MVQLSLSNCRTAHADGLSVAESHDPDDSIEQQLQAIVQHAKYAMEGLPRQNLRHRDLVKVIAAAEQASHLNRRAEAGNERCVSRSTVQQVNTLLEHVVDMSGHVSISRDESVLFPLLHDHSA